MGGWIFAVALLAVGLYVSLGQTHVAPLATLQLTAMRGETQSVLPAQETDITLTDAPVAGTAALRVDLVDSSRVEPCGVRTRIGTAEDHEAAGARQLLCPPLRRRPTATARIRLSRTRCPLNPEPSNSGMASNAVQIPPLS